MNQPSADVRRAVDDIGQIVRRDGGVLDFRTFDPETGELVVAFGQAANDECVTCTIDEPMVRAFLEDAVRAQGIELAALHIRTPSDAGAASRRLDVLNPTADEYGTDVAGLALRPPGLAGQTIGLLWNGKPNGDVALRALGAALESQFEGLRTRFYSGSIPCDRSLLERVARECSAVVGCTADCGSCSSWMTHDIIAMERAGVPAVIQELQEPQSAVQPTTAEHSRATCSRRLRSQGIDPL